MAFIGTSYLLLIGVSKFIVRMAKVMSSGEFGLMVEGVFAYGDGWLIACEPGAPLVEMPAHFGFMLNNRNEVDEWKIYFEDRNIKVDSQRGGNSLFIDDPEGNSFEIFFDPTSFVPPKY